VQQVCDERGDTRGLEWKTWARRGHTYVPSGRFDSGMTRSRV